MLWKLFFTTFFLIFIAELGDKTQLAVLAKSASTQHVRWVVFLGASLALLSSTLVAVLLGGFLSRFNPRMIRLIAGLMFCLFGILILREVWRGGDERASSVRRVSDNPLSRMVLAQAAEFEKAAFSDYHALAARARDPGLKRLLLSIAAEEDAHFRQILEVQSRFDHAYLPVQAEDIDVPPKDALMHDVASAGQDRPIIDHAIEHEQATTGFYRELARLTLSPGLRQTFLALAQADDAHARRLKVWRDRFPDTSSPREDAG